MTAGLQVKTATGWLNASGGSGPAPYVRPSDWLALPTVLDTDKKVVGLVAIFPNDNNFLALSAVGAFTIDWGDGSATQNIATGVQANHQYTYSAISAATLTSRGYRQVVVTITPQAATWTSFSLALKHTQATLANYVLPWLDITAAGTTITACTLRAGNLPAPWLEQFTWKGTNAIVNGTSLFNGCAALQSVSLYAGTMTNMTNLFTNCRTLQLVPLLNTAAVTNMTSMFSGCTSVQTVPLFNTAAVTTMTSMFSGCVSLQTVPLFNTASATILSSMFSGCTSLQTVPLFNTAAVTNMASMFSACSRLQTVPLFITDLVNDVSGMFLTCTSLQTVPLFNTASVTSMTSVFNGCVSLQTVPLFNMAATTTIYGIFTGCTALQMVPLFNTAAIPIMTNVFSGCTALQTVPLLNVTAVTAGNIGGIFTGCTSLGVGRLAGTQISISYSGCALSTAAIVDVIAGLADLTGFGAQTLTLTGNWGYAALTTTQKLVATNKNWTVV